MMSRELIDQACGQWRSILFHVGIAESFLTGKHGPCPMCGGKDRFRFDDKHGSGSWICGQCPDRKSGYGIHLVQGVLGLDFAAALSRVEQAMGGVASVPVIQNSRAPAVLAPSSSGQSGHAKQIWTEATRIKPRSVVASYLAGRGLPFSAYPTSLRHHPQLLYLDEDGNFCGRFPGMLGLIQTKEGSAIGIHRTFLSSDGGQAPVPYPKKIMGSLPDGSAVRLSKHAAVLAISEGIETALSFSRLMNVPAWAALTANNLEKWTPPDCVTDVVVAGDNDASFTGQQAAFALAKRLKGKGFKVSVRIPQQVGDDWNDLITWRG